MLLSPEDSQETNNELSMLSIHVLVKGLILEFKRCNNTPSMKSGYKGLKDITLSKVIHFIASSNNNQRIHREQARYSLGFTRVCVKPRDSRLQNTTRSQAEEQRKAVTTTKVICLSLNSTNNKQRKFKIQARGSMKCYRLIGKLLKCRTPAAIKRQAEEQNTVTAHRAIHLSLSNDNIQETGRKLRESHSFTSSSLLSIILFSGNNTQERSRKREECNHMLFISV